MSDLESFRREAGAQVMPPDFDELVATSRRRRRTAAASAVVAVAAVVSVVAFGLQGVYGDRAAPVPPAGPTRSPTPTPTKDTSPAPDKSPKRLTPTQIVNHPNSTIAAVAVSESSPEVRAVAWRYCSDQRNCNRQVFALTVTADNFQTSHDVGLPGRFWPVVTAVEADSFFAGAGPEMKLVDSIGHVSAVTVEETAGPATAMEVFVGPAANRNNTYLALNPATATAHPISILDSSTAAVSLVENTNGTLVGVVRDSATMETSVIWSRDGGATWSRHQLLRGRSDLVNVIPSTTSSDVLAVVQGGDGATLFPFDKVHRSIDGGATWQTFDESTGDMAYLGWSLVNPDRSLLVNIEAWSDSRAGHPSAHPVGLYQSNGPDWADMRYVQDLPSSAYPEDRSIVSDLTLGDYAPTPSGVLRLWIYDSSHARLFVSGPGIHTWAEVPAR